MHRFSRRTALAGFAAAPVIAAAPLAWGDVSPAALTIDDLTQKRSALGAAMSPDGNRIAVVKQLDEKQACVDLIDLNDPKLQRNRVLLGGQTATGLCWGSDTRLLVAVTFTAKSHEPGTGSHMSQEISAEFARIIAMGLDGRDQAVLFDPDHDISASNLDLTTIVDLLPGDPDRVMMRAWDGDSSGWSLYFVDIHTGKSTLIEHGGDQTAWWWTENGAPVLRQDVNNRGTVTTFFSRRPGESAWRLVRKVRRNELNKPDLIFISPAPSPNSWLVLARADGESAQAVHTFDLTTMTLGPAVLQHPDRDLDDCLVDESRALVGATFTDDRVGYEFIDKSLAPHYRAIGSFLDNDANVELIDISRDHNRLLAFASSPDDPGSYYFYDKAATRLEGLDNAFPTLAAERFAHVQMLDVKSRDGAALRAYLTKPLASGPRPVVVMPHGGPEQRDSYGFDLFAQTMAAQGWLVLQPNFRGSGGYGRAFADAGRRRWADRMQEDVEDAIDAVLKSGAADPKRVAIWGGSYGGYAALMGAVRRPELYRCAVSLAGPSDLAAMLATEKREDPDGLVYQYWIGQIGDPQADAALIAAASPALHADRVQVPVLLLHGLKDVIVEPLQSKIMADALRRAGKTVTHIEYKDAGHHADEWDDKTLKAILTTSVDFIAKAFA